MYLPFQHNIDHFKIILVLKKTHYTRRLIPCIAIATSTLTQGELRTDSDTAEERFHMHIGLFLGQLHY